MILVPYVCAEFHDNTGAVLCTIRPHQLQTIVEVPHAIRQDPLFDMLVKDKTIQVPENEVQRKALENDPQSKLVDIDAIAEKRETQKEETAAVAETAEKPSAKKASK